MKFSVSGAYDRNLWGEQRVGAVEGLRNFRNGLKRDCITRAMADGYSIIRKITWFGHWVEKANLRVITVEIECEKAEQQPSASARAVT